MQLAQRLTNGSIRDVARAISLVESGGPEAEQLIDLLQSDTGGARIVGVTGPPGSGKSTLVDALVAELRAEGERVAVLAVDPSSPFSGGALLGDRLRMGRHAGDPGVFIRSMAARGHPGGLALATSEAADLLDVAGFSTVLIETVGVGQNEVEIMSTADVVLVVLVPGAGDDIQALKAGVMEIGDIYVVNKADLPGAAELAVVLRYVLRGEEEPSQPNGAKEDREHDIGYDSSTLAKPAHAPPVHLTSAQNGEGVAELLAVMRQTAATLKASGELESRRRKRTAATLERITEATVRKWLAEHDLVPRDPDELLREFSCRRDGPYRFVHERLARLLKTRLLQNGGTNR